MFKKSNRKYSVKNFKLYSRFLFLMSKHYTEKQKGEIIGLKKAILSLCKISQVFKMSL